MIHLVAPSLINQGGSLHGKFVDATPFPSSCKQRETSDGSKTLVDELGPLLASHGFNYHGVEVLYSGVLGTELTCEIFIGPVYYQRLRHMVSDKYQVSSLNIFLVCNSVFFLFPHKVGCTSALFLLWTGTVYALYK